MIKNTLISVEEFQQRRKAFMAHMPENSIAFIHAASEVTRSNDTEFPFCQDKNFYYLTGFNEPDALLVLVKTEQQHNAILFCLEKDPLAEVWHGKRIGADRAKKVYGFDDCYNNGERESIIVELLMNKFAVLHCPNAYPEFDNQLASWLTTLRNKAKMGVKAPNTLIDCRSIIHEMRLIKSPAELDIMRQVNITSSKAHQRAMEKIFAGQFEYQLEAEIIHEFSRNGARYPAYGTIVAGGDNANILHYTDNNDAFSDGDLVLIDAGGEQAGYAADITRTFPVSGKFSTPQKALYQLVLDCQETVINAIKPGQTFAYLNKLACEVLTKGLLDLGILSGDFEQLMAEKACKQYFIHGLGHWLGLDVHDVGDYQINENKEQMRAFEPGMILTIEPGLYFPKGSPVDDQYQGIGIRIEDNILVTETGYENFSASAPKTIADIEQIMAK